MTRPDYVPDDAEDITDYGAVENQDDPDLASAQTNIEAIRDAANAAGDEGGIYVPRGTYYCGHNDSSRMISFGDREPKGISWYGDGPEKSIIALTEHLDPNNDSHVLMRYRDDGTGLDHGTVAFEQMQFDGNAQAIDSEEFKGGTTTRTSNAVRLDNRDLVGKFDMYNMLFFDWHDIAVRVRGTWPFDADRCTFRRNGAESRIVGASGHQVAIGDDGTFTNCNFRRAGSYHINFNAGDGVLRFENCYLKGQGNGLVKYTAGDRLEFQNVYGEPTTQWVQDNFTYESSGGEFHGRHFVFNQYISEGADPKVLQIRDSEFRDCTHNGLYTRRNMIVDAHNVALHNTNSYDQGLGAMTTNRGGNESNLDFDMDGQEISVHNSTGDVVTSGSTSDSTLSGTIGTLYRNGNEDGPDITGEDSLAIGSDIGNAAPLEPDVPSEDEVGINTGSGANDEEEEDSTTELSDEEEAVFEGWTPKWASNTNDWSVSENSSNVGDATLELETDSAGRHALACDAIKDAADVDVVGLVRVPSDDDGSSSWCRLVGRGSGTAGSETGYFVAFRDVPQFGLTRYVNGDSQSLVSKEIDNPVGTWFYVRLNIQGDSIRARHWQYSETEPTEWDLSVRDDSITGSGWAGVGGWSTDTQQNDYFSIATDGDTAPLSALESVPTVSWETPSGGEAVSKTITVQIDASDEDDDAGSLDVDYRVDDGSWSAAPYNSETGYYEDNWDSQTVADGEYTLEARVTDSASNTLTATVDVVVENDGSSVAVESIDARDVTASAAALVGELTSLEGADEAGVGFEWRQSGEDSWNIAGEQTVDSVKEFRGEVSDLQSGTDYEFRATADAHGDYDTGATLAFTTENDDEDGDAVPAIEQFEVTDRSNPTWSWFDVDWTVSHEDGELDTVVTKLRYKGSVVDAESTSITGETASYTHSMRVRGPVDEVVLSVNDTENQVIAEVEEV